MKRYRNIDSIAFLIFLLSTLAALASALLAPGTTVGSVTRRSTSAFVGSGNTFATFSLKSHSNESRKGVNQSLFLASLRGARELRCNENGNNNLFSQLSKSFTTVFLALAVSFSSISSGPFAITEPANASDGGAIGICLLKKCPIPLAKCIINPWCLANVICINTCNGKPDEIDCQIKCGDTFENNVVGEFNKCAVSDMDCVPQRQDDGSYPVPPKDVTVSKFDTKLWNGRWYITAGQNELFDIFPCQVHFFTETEPGKFFGKLNWRIEEPDGEFFTRDAVQRFVQDPDWPGHMINHDNEYLHYKDDWYILDYAMDGNDEGVPPFAFIYYRGSNDAWVGYGGAFVYTRESKLPETLLPRLRKAAKRVNFDFDKDFTITDNTCRTLEKGEILMLREKFAGKFALQTEKQLQAQAVRVRGNAADKSQTSKDIGDKKTNDAFKELKQRTREFEDEILKDVRTIEDEIVGSFNRKK